MEQVREQVRLHPETVSNAEQVAKEIEAAKKAYPRKRASKPVKTQVHPLVWKTAMRLASGNLKRIRVQSETCVLVVNR